MWYVYVLKCLNDDTFYTSMSKNVEQRLKYHNSGKSRYTKGHIPYKVIYTKLIGKREDARIREKYLKSSVSKRLITKIPSNS
ncbi:MAG: GIY-YIG nuclease family protein [Candidatus Marinimicrobia bacterium]|nr:GIY-YIG nuclease family protein [Candidatus Neomarinimicrobiota bacterium]